jgi:hypothetical protein
MLALALAVLQVSCANTSEPSRAAPSPEPSPVPAAPPRPLESASIAITTGGLVLDPALAGSYALATLRVYQGGTLTFTNRDQVPHDILSSPPQTHTDCPEINRVGFLVPGQSRSTQALNRLVTCGFHDHTHEGDPRWEGRVTIEAR